MAFLFSPDRLRGGPYYGTQTLSLFPFSLQFPDPSLQEVLPAKAM